MFVSMLSSPGSNTTSPVCATSVVVPDATSRSVATPAPGATVSAPAAPTAANIASTIALFIATSLFAQQTYRRGQDAPANETAL